MRSPTKYILVAALLWGAAAQAQDRPAGSQVELTDEHMDRIARIANKFKGSIFLFDQSITPDVLNAGDEQSNIPSYQWWMSFRPRYYIKPNLSLRLRMDLTVEWLNAADTTFVREGQFGDVWLDLAYNAPTFWGIVPTIALRTVWGTSKEAIAAGDVLNVGPVVGLVREFQTNKVGSFELSLSMYGLIHASPRIGGLVNGNYFHCDSLDLRATICDTTGGPSNTAFNLTTFLSAKWAPVSQFSLSLSYAVLDGWAWNTADAVDPVYQQPINRSPNDTRFRQSSWFIANLDYEPRDWITLSLGYYCLRPIRDKDEAIGDPFYYPAGNTGSTRIYLTTTFNLDRVYDAAARRMQPKKASAEASPTGANFAWSR
jgi:hypothetical protein